MWLELTHVSRPFSQSPESWNGQAGKSQERADQGEPKHLKEDYLAFRFVPWLDQGQVFTSCTSIMLPVLHYAHCQLQQLVPSLAKHCRQSMFFSVANSCLKTPDNALIWQLFLFFFVMYVSCHLEVSSLSVLWLRSDSRLQETRACGVKTVWYMLLSSVAAQCL